MDTFPDLGSLSDAELKDLINELTEEETEVSYQRRILHGKIDILRAELVNRLQHRHANGEQLISGADVQQLTDILAGRTGDAGRIGDSGQRPVSPGFGPGRASPGLGRSSTGDGQAE